MGVRKHFDRPIVYANQEDARIIAIPVLGGDEVDVGILGWWEKSCPGNAGVQYNGVGVKPTAPIDISDSLQTFLQETTSSTRQY